MLRSASLVNTLPITKKNKRTVVTEAPKKSTCAAFALENFLEKANSGSNWRLSSERVGGTECSFVCHVPGTRGISPGYFAPTGHRLNVFLRRRALADLSIACPLSC